MSAQREMTLQEWVYKLPNIHPARKELDSMQAKVAELEQQRRQWLDTDLCGMVVRDQERAIVEQAALIEQCELALKTCENTTGKRGDNFTYHRQEFDNAAVKEAAAAIAAYKL